jgi:alkylation response protein AidB-like acyl-CoA dehydrogenase
MHNLQLTEDQDLIVDTVRKFVADVVAPKALEHDEHRHYAGRELDGLAELGMFGLLVSEANGGAGLGVLPFVAALEALGAHSSSLASLWVDQARCAVALEAVGAPELEAAITGASRVCFVGPEHGLRAGAAGVDGSAELVAGAGVANVFLLAATQDGQPVLALADAAAVGRTELRSLGLASAAPARLAFAGVKVRVLATGADAAAAIARAQVIGWTGAAATAVGGGAASIVAARKHAGERIAFGKPLLAQEAVVRKLVDSQRMVDAARHLVWHAARLADLGLDATETAIQARIAAIEAMVAAADEAIQIHGGFGYTVEYHVERHYRDGKTLEVLDVGNDRLRDRLAACQFG